MGARSASKGITSRPLRFASRLTVRVEHRAQRPRDRLRFVRATEGGADGEALRAGGEDFLGVFDGDAAERESGQRSLAHRLANEIEAGELFELLRLRGEDRADADVAGAIADRLVKLLQRMGADADE